MVSSYGGGESWGFFEGRIGGGRKDGCGYIVFERLVREYVSFRIASSVTCLGLGVGTREVGGVCEVGRVRAFRFG